MTELAHTLTREPQYSDLELLADVDEELPYEVNIEIGVEFQFHGEYHAATYWEPGEDPELEISSVYLVDEDGTEIEGKITLTPAERKEVERACWDYEEDYCPY